MDRAHALALAAYAALVGSLATPLYEPLSAGRDDSWLLVVLLAGAHLGVGMVVRRAWVLLLPVGVSLIAFVLAGAQGLAWLVVLFELPLLVGTTALGWVLGGRIAGRAALVAAAAFAMAALPGAWAALETVKRAPHVSAREQRALPTMAYSLVQDLCFRNDSGFDRAYAEQAHRRARREFVALERGLRTHQHALVSVRFVLSDAPGTSTRKMTIRELAETHVEGARLDGPPLDGACYRLGRARLERALDRAG
jgi:hypothetical protein